jgi:hypothetical protein
MSEGSTHVQEIRQQIVAAQRRHDAGRSLLTRTSRSPTEPPGRASTPAARAGRMSHGSERSLGTARRQLTLPWASGLVAGPASQKGFRVAAPLASATESGRLCGSLQSQRRRIATCSRDTRAHMTDSRPRVGSRSGLGVTRPIENAHEPGETSRSWGGGQSLGVPQRPVDLVDTAVNLPARRGRQFAGCGRNMGAVGEVS